MTSVSPRSLISNVRRALCLSLSRILLNEIQGMPGHEVDDQLP